jgi:hypothetical protein
MTANLITGVAWHLGFPIHYLQAVRDIRPGEQLCISYGKNYWESFLLGEISPCLFNTEGEVIARSKKHYGFTTIFEVENLNVDSLENAPRSTISLYKLSQEFPLACDNNSPVDVPFLLKLICLSVNNYIQCIPEDNIEARATLYTYIDNIMSDEHINFYRTTRIFFDNKQPFEPLYQYLLNLLTLINPLHDEETSAAKLSINL